MAGRPTLLTTEVHDKIVQALRSGSSFEDAAEYAYVHVRRVHEWRSRGARVLASIPDGEDIPIDHPELKYALFSQDCAQASAMCKVHTAAEFYAAAIGRPAVYDEFGNMIRAEIPPDGNMACKWLERRDPEGWGRVHRLQLARDIFEVENIGPENTALERAMGEIDRLAEKMAHDHQPKAIEAEIPEATIVED